MLKLTCGIFNGILEIERRAGTLRIILVIAIAALFFAAWASFAALKQQLDARASATQRAAEVLKY